MAGNEKRTVLVESISYLGADGEDHIGVRDEEITVHKDGVATFDFIHNDTPEYRAFGKPVQKTVVEAKKA